MVQRNNPNFLQLARAVEKLTPLLEEIVFVGGCVTGLLITDPAAAPVRPTVDVDAIIEISSYAEFMLTEGRLRNLGFSQSSGESVPICRWFADRVILDLMPTDPAILGISNRWYKPAMQHSQRIRIGEHDVRVITAPYFLGTKFEAFHARGKGDFALSASHYLQVGLHTSNPYAGGIAKRNVAGTWTVDGTYDLQFQVWTETGPGDPVQERFVGGGYCAIGYTRTQPAPPWDVRL